MAKKANREQEFENHFASVYGERWPSLRASLLREVEKTVLENPWGAPYHDYSLDPASLAPARALAPKPGDRVADFCASPGGKSLSMIFALRGEAEWSCNDLSPARVARLKAVFHDCLPPAVLARVRFSTGDASRWGMKFPGQFDRVLVDAPCSGERHLLASPQELARWSFKGVKGLAIRQHALLCSALDCLRPGGRVVYSTCSIEPTENDGVIDRLLKSRAGLFRIADETTDGEPTAHGRILLPDATGSGPIYFCILEKLG